MKSLPRCRRPLALLAAALLLAGCAQVLVNKVDRATGQVVPNSAEGLRFYLPRPYVSVFEPFIVASEVWYRPLADDRTAVEPGIDEMYGATADRHAVVQRLALGV